ncbi:MAG: flagellar hook-associated protein FlgK, partial [Gammaproteobacteria bacterium]|nr:flagellar hook-associated protein FlgK [Gammaproteobacteria bacterium]
MADPLRTGSSALLAFQRAIATTSHNISNSATEGYTRQQVDFSANLAVQKDFGYVGQGVLVADIKRLEDTFAQKQLFVTGAELARVSTLHEYAGQLDSLLADDGLNLAPALNDFFDALADANNNPTDIVTRHGVVNAADNLTRSFNSLSDGLESTGSQYRGALQGSVNEINSLSKQLADVNSSIMSVYRDTSSRTPNDLIDERNRLLSQLSEQVGITTIETSDGGTDVYIAHGQALVTGSEAMELTVIS